MIGQATNFRKCRYTVLILLVGMFIGCTENTLFSDATFGSEALQGSIILDDGSGPEGIYIWLEGLNVGTFSNETGEFRLEIPTPHSQGSEMGITGELKLYFFIANFDLDSVIVRFNRGTLVRGQTYVQDDGNLRQPMTLSKILDVTIAVKPQAFSLLDTVAMRAVIGLRSIYAPVGITSRRKVVNKALLRTGLIISDWEGNAVRMVDLEGAVSRTEIIGTAEVEWSIDFDLYPGELSTGSYTIVPYLVITHQKRCEVLIKSLGSDIEDFGPQYLHLPFRRRGGNFIVSG